MMERMFPGVQLRVLFSLGARQAVTATGQKGSVTERTIPLQLALVTPSGPAPLPPISFAIMPGSDGVLLLGLPTLKDLGVDPYDRIRDSMQQRMSPPNQGVETPAFLGSRRVSLSVAALQEAGGQATEEPDLAVERLVERGPEMFMDPAEEESARKVALEESVTDAVAQGLSVSKAERLRGILSRRFNAFRRALRGDPPARVEPMRVQLKPGASAVKAKPRRYDPVKTSWLASCVAALLAFGLVFRNLQAVWSSPAMAVPKKDSFRLVSDYKAVNEQVEKSPGVMPNQEADMVDLLSARFFDKSDLLQGYWQMPLAEEAREMGLFAAAHKCTFFSREIVWCGKVYSQGHVSHDPVRLQGLSDMRRPETAAKLMKFSKP